MGEIRFVHGSFYLIILIVIYYAHNIENVRFRPAVV